MHGSKQKKHVNAKQMSFFSPTLWRVDTLYSFHCQLLDLKVNDSAYHHHQDNFSKPAHPRATQNSSFDSNLCHEQKTEIYLLVLGSTLFNSSQHWFVFPRCNLVAVQCRVNAHLLSHQSQSGMPGTLVPPLFFIHARARFYCSLIASKTLLIVCCWFLASCDTTQLQWHHSHCPLNKIAFLLSFARCGNDLSEKRHVPIFQEQTTFYIKYA